MHRRCQVNVSVKNDQQGAVETELATLDSVWKQKEMAVFMQVINQKKMKDDNKKFTCLVLSERIVVESVSLM